MGRFTFLAAAIVAVLVCPVTGAAPTRQRAAEPAPSASIEEALRLFYSGRYEAAAALTLDPCFSLPNGLAACEVRATALLFQIKRALGDAADKQKALKQCAPCPELFTAFLATTVKGKALAAERLKADPEECATLFLLGKLNLNHVWLQTGTLGRKTGWNEYWDGRRAVEKVLKQNPNHVRARVARAWIDYIVDTRIPRGTRWLFGGGNKKRGLRVVREAAAAESDFFSQVEARFALWDMQVRERDLQEAVITARTLARDFPENPELTRFIETHEHLIQH